MAILVILFILMTIVSTVIILSAAIIASRSDRWQQEWRTGEELEWSMRQISSLPLESTDSEHDDDNNGNNDDNNDNNKLTYNSIDER